eukprot:357611-Chlamydomonas_euryale.AAC.6
MHDATGMIQRVCERPDAPPNGPDSDRLCMDGPAADTLPQATKFALQTFLTLRPTKWATGLVTQSTAKGRVTQPTAKGTVTQPTAKGRVTQPTAKGRVTQPTAKGTVTQPTAKGTVIQPTAKGRVTQPTARQQSTSPCPLDPPPRHLDSCWRLTAAAAPSALHERPARAESAPRQGLVDSPIHRGVVSSPQPCLTRTEHNLGTHRRATAQRPFCARWVQPWFNSISACRFGARAAPPGRRSCRALGNALSARLLRLLGLEWRRRQLKLVGRPDEHVGHARASTCGRVADGREHRRDALAQLLHLLWQLAVRKHKRHKRRDDEVDRRHAAQQQDEHHDGTRLDPVVCRVPLGLRGERAAGIRLGRRARLVRRQASGWGGVRG